MSGACLRRIDPDIADGDAGIHIDRIAVDNTHHADVGGVPRQAAENKRTRPQTSAARAQ
jgi:hypothetical protein